MEIVIFMHHFPVMLREEVEGQRTFPVGESSKREGGVKMMLKKEGKGVLKMERE